MAHIVSISSSPMFRTCGNCRRLVSFTVQDYQFDDIGLGPGGVPKDGVKCPKCGRRIQVSLSEIPPAWRDYVLSKEH